MKLSSLALFLVTMLFGMMIPEDCIAVEIDDITGYYTPLKDANKLLDTQINAVFAKSLEMTNSCDPKELLQNTKSLLRPKGLVAKIFGGGLEEWVLGNKEIERYTPGIDTSIYRDTPYSRSYIANGAKIIKIATVYPSIRINGNFIGVDKLSHFFETGLELYTEHLTPELIEKNGRDKQIQELVDHAIELEETHLGWTITGIKSYGDILSHLQGAFFWAQYFKVGGSWLKCENNKFMSLRKFSISDYAQSGWSEAVQCNEYVPASDQTYLEKFFNKNSKTFQQEVDVNIAALESKFSRRYQCPIVPAQCQVSVDFLKKSHPYLTSDQVQKVTSPHCH